MISSDKLYIAPIRYNNKAQLDQHRSKDSSVATTNSTSPMMLIKNIYTDIVETLIINEILYYIYIYVIIVLY